NSCLGRALFNQVIERLNGIVAKDYFGLSYLLYLQLRRDLHSGRLIGRNTEMHMLAACILQAEIGDHDVLVEYLGSEGTLADLKMFANVTPRTEAKICELHKTLKGLSMEEAENKFLEHASRFETYGIEPLYVQDRKGNHFYMGLSHEGVVTFRGSRKAHVFTWHKINKISYEGKLFIIQVEWEQRRHTLGFKCPTAESAEALWKWAVDRQCFFTLSRSVDAKESKANGGIFKRRQFYTFTGRCQKELMLLNSSLPTIPQPSVSRSRSLLNLAKSVRQTRQSKSQNDLDRKLAVSHDNLHDGDMNSSTALQRHQSALETRQTEEAGNLMPTSNHLGQQVRGIVGNGGQGGLTKAINNTNSQSTPSLLHSVPPTQQQAVEPPMSGLNGVRDAERSIRAEAVPVSSANEGGSKQEVLSTRGEGVLSTDKNDVILTNTKGETDRLSEQQQQELSEPKITDGDESKQTVVQTKPEPRQPVEDSDISDIEQNAEATDQLAEDGDAFGNTGSVNTLSSSPLHSADDEDETDGAHKSNHGKPHRNNESQVFLDDTKPTAAKRTVKSVTTNDQVGNWLGAEGIRTYASLNNGAHPQNNIPRQTSQYSEMSERNKYLQTGRSSLTYATTTTWTTSPRPSVHEIDRTSTYSKPHNAMISESEAEANSIALNIRRATITRTSTQPMSISSTPRPSSMRSNQMEPRTSLTTGSQRPTFISSIEPMSRSLPSQCIGIRDVEEYIDSNESYSTTEPFASNNFQPMSSNKLNGRVPKPALSKPPLSPPQGQTATDLYFPFARNMKPCPPYSSLANRPQDYRTLAAIPSRRSPTRRELRFATSKNRNSDRSENVPVTPLEIDLSIENFSRTPPMMVLDRRERPMVEQLTTSHSSNYRSTRRSQDLSPQPRDWHQPTNRSLSPTEHSTLPSFKELVISPSTTCHSFGTTHSTATSPMRPSVEEVCVPTLIKSCGFYSSSVPSAIPKTDGTEPDHQVYKSPSRTNNEILLEHGYRPSVAGHQSRVDSHLRTTDTASTYRDLGSSAAQLAAGGTVHPQRTVRTTSSEHLPITDLDSVASTSRTKFAVPGIAQTASESSGKSDGESRLRDQPAPIEQKDVREQRLAEMKRSELRSRSPTTNTTSTVPAEIRFRRLAPLYSTSTALSNRP
ncbi:Band 4.1-like protein 3, variant 2, partial [Clonorchis sinensis]